jgi:hypothetical protein
MSKAGMISLIKGLFVVPAAKLTLATKERIEIVIAVKVVLLNGLV